MRIVLFIFIAMPIIEMVVLIKVGGIIGTLPTVGLVLLTAMVGVALLRHQGISALRRAQEKMQGGTIPLNEMVEGVFLAVGGALLLTPGFVTDGVGFCCLLPGIRHFIIARGMKLWTPNVVGFRKSSMGGRNFTDTDSHADTAEQNAHNTIDGQFKRED